jgi:microcystin-dependent protein
VSEVFDTAVNPDADGLVGSVQVWPGDVLPSTKYRWCEGDTVSRTEFSLLFSRIGELHGVGDGSTTFNLPNYKQKFLVGFDSSDTAYDTVGETGGSATGAVSGTTGNESSHTHGAGSYSVDAPTAAASGPSVPAFSGSSGPQPVSGTSGAGSAHNHSFSGTAATIPPYNVVRWIIKVL